MVISFVNKKIIQFSKNAYMQPNNVTFHCFSLFLMCCIVLTCEFSLTDIDSDRFIKQFAAATL